ncbi:MAG: hypothetical protein LBR51_01290 [Bacteroidales bacterium]|nr:hypothetical protein [Bacteroidales bacterium]
MLNTGFHKIFLIAKINAVIPAKAGIPCNSPVIAKAKPEGRPVIAKAKPEAIHFTAFHNLYSKFSEF